jgi:hypothetical protein
MPIPLLLLAVAAIASIGGAVVVACNWEKIHIALHGKRLAVLGERGVGKTSLITFLQSGTLPVRYCQTGVPKKAAARRFQLEDLDINLKEMYDLSGDESAYGQWKIEVGKADALLYLLRADKIHAGNRSYETRVKNDLRHLADWLEEQDKRPHLLLVATHCDKVSELSNISSGKYAGCVDKFRKLPVVSELVERGGGNGQVRIVLGSLKNTPRTQNLVYSIFESLSHET